MVSRRSIGPLRKILPAVAVGLVALGIAGCSAGQVSQTDQMEPAVNGTSADVGAIALRNIVVAYPATDSYRAGGDAPLTLAIVNTGGTDDKLTAVSSPAAGTVELVGDTSVPARSALAVVVPEEPATSSPAEPTESAPSSSASSSSAPESGPESGPESSASPTFEPTPSSATELTPEVTGSATAPDVVGSLSIVLRELTADLPLGKNVPITFVFEHAGQVTITVPIDNPGDDEPSAVE